MQDLMVLLLGGAVGASAAWLVAFFAMPTALQMFGQTKGFGLPLSVGERQAREHLVRRCYLVLGPLFSGVGCAVLALRMFGSGQ